jgi:hypothetical protein
VSTVGIHPVKYEKIYSTAFKENPAPVLPTNHDIEKIQDH